MFRAIFLFFAASSAFLGLGMAVISGGNLGDVRGWLAVLAGISAVMHLVCARGEQNRHGRRL